MGAVAQLSSPTIDVEPGRAAELTIDVRNTGSVVDRFTFEALGSSKPWVTFVPESISLFPGASGTAKVVVTAPRDPSTTAGSAPLGIRVASSEDPDGSVVEEATLVVLAFSDVSMEVVPKIARASRWGRARLAVDNRSNCVYRGELTGADPRAALGIALSPAVVEVRPGEAVFVRASLRPKKVFWRGSSQTHPYMLTLRSKDPGTPHPAEVTTDGTLIQDPLLPHWLLVAAGAVAALAALLVLLWFVLFRPQIRSTARDQVNKQLAAAGLVTSPSGSSKPAAGGGGGGGSSSTTVPVVVAPSTGASQSVNGSVQAAGNGTKVLYTVPLGQSLQVTDLLVENSAGDTGTLTLARNGAPIMQWALANFRDLDYHWITPTMFGPGTQMQMVVSGCPNACTPGVYFAGNLLKTS